LSIILCRGLGQRVTVGNAAILGPTATRTPSTRGESQLERDVECGAIHAGLAARHAALDAVCGLAIRWGRRAERGAVPRLFG